MMAEFSSSAEVLGGAGPFAQSVQGFSQRCSQQDFADAVEKAIEARSVLVAEAGTGTGKTFAYLVPVMRSGCKTIISTGTRNLQDQLYQRDVPEVRRALGGSASVALLKGRSNYLCPYRLVRNGDDTGVAAELAAIRDWAGRTRSGDIAEVSGISESSRVWGLVTSTADNCLGQECPELTRCHVLQARRVAQEADVVIVNHHLLCADMALKDEGFGEVLPSAQVFVIDEAHQLPEVAAAFFGTAIGSRQVLDLCRDVVAEQLQDAPDMTGLRQRAAAAEKAVADLRLALGREVRRAAWVDVATEHGVHAAVEGFSHALRHLTEGLVPAEERGKGLEQCLRRAQDLTLGLDLFEAAQEGEHVRWLETRPRSFTLHRTPLDVAPGFRAQMERFASAWVFTSATLTVAGRFEFYARRAGVDDADFRSFDSPFDYAQQALLYIPQLASDPRDPSYADALVEVTLPVVRASRGRTFFLFTSHRALQHARALLEGRLPYPILVQGSAPRARLLERFRELGNAVLLGTSSFWEGVDVRGPALSCVIIDKLPFAPPEDPVLKARIRHMREQGDNPFTNYQLPQAVLALKQGVGRLIRDVTDRGVLVLCDPRLYSKPYGRVFRESLPAVPVTRELVEVEDFYADDAAEDGWP